MFYPANSLKRGGKFYLCWVADSWPLRFATITHRQLWSQDIRKLCDDLMEVMTNESGRPTNRFSLRLSSQLMRGLVRLYEKKVNIFLNDMCMLNANVFKHTNKKFDIHECTEEKHPERPQRQVLLQLPQAVVQEERETVPTVEVLIQNSGNVVANIQDITLKEAVIPEFQLPPNDGFGEENPEQALQFLADRTLEMMMVPTDLSAAQHSGLDMTRLELTEKSHDKSRLMPQVRQMERLSDLDLTLFGQSRAEVVLPGADFEKEIPEISEIPIPEMPVPQEKLAQLREQEQVVEIPQEVGEPQKENAPISDVPGHQPRARRRTRESDQIELQELEETSPQPKRRRLRGLIIDKKIKLTGEYLRARIENPLVELRCKDASEDIIEIRVSSEVLLRRACHAGYRTRSNFPLALSRLFLRNLGVINRPASFDRDIEEGMMRPSLRSTRRSILERIEEIEEPTIGGVVQPQTEQAPETTLPVNQDMLAPQDVSVLKDLTNIKCRDKDQDISELLTRKRPSVNGALLNPKKWRPIGQASFKESQNKQLEMEIAVPVFVGEMANNEDSARRALSVIISNPAPPQIETSVIIHKEADKENVPISNKSTRRSQDLAVETEAPASKKSSTRRSDDVTVETVTALLHEAGLSDIPTRLPSEAERSSAATRKVSGRLGSEGSETPLGSLDRTKVSLGDSEKTTDSIRYIREQWGATGTMLLIMKCVKENYEPITVRNLIAKGPVVPGHVAICAARCFSSILKLKSHGFIRIQKNPETLEIEGIKLGTKFY